MQTPYGEGLYHRIVHIYGYHSILSAVVDGCLVGGSVQETVRVRKNKKNFGIGSSCQTHANREI